MTGSTKEWIFVALFFGAFLILTLGELYWLNKKGGVGIRRAMIYVFSVNFTTITVGFFVSFIIFAVLLAIAWDANTPMPGGEAGATTTVIAMAVFPFLLMLGLRLLLIRLLSLRQTSGLLSSPFKYSLLFSVLFFLFVVAVPTAFLFVF